MIGKNIVLVSVLLFCVHPLFAAEQYRDLSVGEVNSTTESGSDDRNSVGRVIVNTPPEAMTRGQNNNQPPCQRCCTYENRSYTEGAVVRMDGVLLQCARDEQSFGTNNLIWKQLKQ